MLLTAALSSLLATPTLVSPAQPPPRASHLGVNLGFGSPVGALGLTYDRDLRPWFQLQAGVGIGGSGFQLAATPRLVHRLRGGHALLAGLGPSVAVNPEPGDRETPALLWINGEVGYQHEGERLFFQAGVGAAVIAAGKMREPCLLCDPESWRPGTLVPSFRITCGWRL